VEKQRGQVFRFAGFELDSRRGEFRGPNGETIRLRPKSFAMLRLFAANPGRVVSKQELMEAVWPNVNVGEDSLFQCIREIRTALGDDQRQLVRVVSGHGYLFDVEVSGEPACAVAEKEAVPSPTPAGGEPDESPEPQIDAMPARKPQFRFGLSGPAALGIVAGLGAIIGLAVAAPIFRPDFMFGQTPPTIAVMPIINTTGDPDAARMAVNVSERLADGLAKIGNIRVVAPRWQASSSSPEIASARATQADLAVTGELQKSEKSWNLQARMVSTASGEVRWTTSVAVRIDDADVVLQQSRLAAGVGHPLALAVNALLNSGMRSVKTDSTAPAGAKVVIDQAMAFINQTTPERFKSAQAMLEQALAAEPDNVDLQAALAAHLLRGVQSAWYDPADVAAAQSSAQSMLERALRAKPAYLPVLEGYCRFLAASNHFVESLVACAKALTFDPWDGIALFHLGMTQIRLGRFEDALATFRQADRFDTPQVSRWTWLLGAGWSCLLMGRDEEASSWLQRSIAITPGTGRTHLLLAAAYWRLGRTDEARAAVVKALELRPGSTADNALLPAKNASPDFLNAQKMIQAAQIEAGLPER
jgi:DNA-binding winged helix-turn-helix (wHTH) protein/Flp pilus assembly protein TadD/TolB-like protein